MKKQLTIAEKFEICEKPYECQSCEALYEEDDYAFAIETGQCPYCHKEIKFKRGEKAVMSKQLNHSGFLFIRFTDAYGEAIIAGYHGSKGKDPTICETVAEAEKFIKESCSFNERLIELVIKGFMNSEVGYWMYEQEEKC